MDSQTQRFLAYLLSSGAVGSTPVEHAWHLQQYYSGQLRVPQPIEADLDAWLGRADPAALLCAAQWLVQGYALADSFPSLHLAWVKRLLDEGRLQPQQAIPLLALQPAHHTLDEQGQEIAWLALHAVEEGREAEEQQLLLSLLATYPHPPAPCRTN
ncbi:hypothetical protein [Stenotrophomonas sp. YAU14D1_LEIMI4_1]|uniref:hypothetical protein n=1 Tax=Stenotrophomonas sp. YAU14D1_LEIMI4_1 TaxID=2072407 RepID=UPI000D53D881|nr:hypothetical protein [Stenotrophomonas sp. YAU14D1_LEIMI4_1]AWH24683.1 hypothetical protein C1932_05935 [Stenotrophomonas sp. YAU14D1_LEIMI4_1]